MQLWNYPSSKARSLCGRSRSNRSPLTNCCATSPTKTFLASGYWASSRQGGLVRRKGEYVPERGDAVWIALDPQAATSRRDVAPPWSCLRRLQRSRWVGSVVPDHHTGERLSVRGALTCGIARGGCGGGGPGEEPGLAGVQNYPDRCCPGGNRCSSRKPSSNIARRTRLTKESSGPATTR